MYELRNGTKLRTTKLPRVLIFSTAYLPHIGGAELAVKEITDRLKDEYNWEMMTVRLSREDAREELLGAIRVYRLGWGLGRLDKFIFPFLAARRAASLHREHPYSLIWSIMASFSGFGAVLFKKRFPQIPFLLTLQEGDDVRVVQKKVNWPVIQPWFQEIFTLSDAVQAISGYLADWAKRMKVQAPVQIVPNGVAATTEHECDRHREKVNKLRQQLGLGDEARVVLSTSRLVKKNGLPDLIAAMGQLPDTVHLVLCGGGDDRAELERLVKNLGLAKRAHFIGAVAPDALRSYYCLAAETRGVFCRPSISEGLGNSFLEAMSYSLPVVGTPVGGIPDFLRDGETGLFCEVGNPVSIAEKIRYILDPAHHDEVERITRTAFKLVNEKFTWDMVAREIRFIFDRLLGV